MKIKRIKSFLRIAKSIAQDSPCSRKKFGAILVKDGDIISTGYNGSVRGAINCGTEIECAKDIHNEPHYTSYFYCPAIHAEHNACLNAGRRLAMGSTMFLSKADGDGMSGPPCIWCRRAMIQCSIKDIYYYDYDGKIIHNLVQDWIYSENELMLENLVIKE